MSLGFGFSLFSLGLLAAGTVFCIFFPPSSFFFILTLGLADFLSSTLLWTRESDNHIAYGNPILLAPNFVLFPLYYTADIC